MSFIRAGQMRRKKTSVLRRRPEWDGSVSDLDSYRATPEEIKQRRESHKSKNHITVKLEKIKKEKQNQRSGLTNVEARQVAILKEVLHDQQQLDNVLSKSDQMMALVKDLFGDEAKTKFTGHPQVTVPPGSRNTTLPRAPEIHTRIEKLSESMMSQSALNDDVSDDEEDDDDDEEDDGQRPEPVTFQPQLDLQRFHQFLRDEENRNSNAIPSTSAMTQQELLRLQQLQQMLLGGGMQAGGHQGVQDGNHTLSTISGNAGAVGGGPLYAFPTGQGPAHSTQLMAHTSAEGYQTPPNSIQTSSSHGGTPPRSALNDTAKVKKTKKHVKPAESAPTNNTSSFNMTDMRQALDSLQAEITDFERRTGRHMSSGQQNNQTFTGYTVALVTAVSKLTHYMKETELRLQAEMMVREHLAQDVRQLTVTIDSLTQEIILTQEEHGKLGSEFKNYKQQVQSDMAVLQAQILELQQNQSTGSKHSTPGKAAASAKADNDDESFAALPEHVPQPTSTAFLLSPVVRKTRVVDENPPAVTKPKRQTSLVDIPSMADDDNNTSRQPQQRAPAAFSSYSRGDPPRLTQTLPVMGTVNVPRPIPLVQSNVSVSLSGSQAAGPLPYQSQPRNAYPSASTAAASQPPPAATATTSTLQASSGSTTSRDSSRVMETQIAELSRQHAEAQQRLQSLLVQQKRQHDQLQHLQDDDVGGGGGGGRVQTQGRAPTSISPPISPISLRSEHFANQDPAQRLATMSREIRVSMPVVDLEVSAGSLNGSF